MIKLITGKPGSYKSAFAMEMANKAISEGRNVVFCNWRGLSPEFQTIEDFSNWYDFPDGTLFLIDEIQEFSRSVPTNAKTEELPKHFQLLEKHRHRGMDFIVTTQHPKFIHIHIRRLTEEHYHMHRTNGTNYAMKRMWYDVCENPEDKQNTTIEKGCTVTRFTPDKSVFNNYESTVLDTHKFKLPSGLISKLLPVLILLVICISLGYPVVSKFFGSSTTAPSTTTNTPQTPQTGLIPSLIPQQPVFSYEPTKPFDSSGYTYTPTEAPHLAGCISDAKRCKCYSQQGSLLQVSAADCKRVITEGMPFNPFLTREQINRSKLTEDGKGGGLQAM